jgi:hypothetical protein
VFYICYSAGVAVGVGSIRGFIGLITEVALSIPVNHSINQTARAPMIRPSTKAKIDRFLPNFIINIVLS